MRILFSHPREATAVLGRHALYAALRQEGHEVVLAGAAADRWWVEALAPGAAFWGLAAPLPAETVAALQPPPDCLVLGDPADPGEEALAAHLPAVPVVRPPRPREAAETPAELYAVLLQRPAPALPADESLAARLLGAARQRLAELDAALDAAARARAEQEQQAAAREMRLRTELAGAYTTLTDARARLMDHERTAGRLERERQQAVAACRTVLRRQSEAEAAWQAEREQLVAQHEQLLAQHEELRAEWHRVQTIWQGEREQYRAERERLQALLDATRVSLEQAMSSRWWKTGNTVRRVLRRPARCPAQPA